MQGKKNKKKFHLKEGDMVFVYWDKYKIETPVKVKGFCSYGMHTEELGVIPFTAYRFYGSGYSQTQRFITVKKKWHYKWALIAEWIRLNLTNK